MKSNFLLLCFLIANFCTFAQYHFQYFDGADTIPQQSVFIRLDTDSSNIWEIGKPQKTIFSTAKTVPNTIVTDKVNPYPKNNLSRFQFSCLSYNNWGVSALQWAQKFDMSQNADGGMVEFSFDGGNIWLNAFNNPYVYNFYGFDTANKGTLANGMLGFTGRDTAWKDIWLCFNNSWSSQFDSIIVRFTLVSDSVEETKEGWLVDNIIVKPTIIHTAVTPISAEYLKVYPNPTKDILYIELQKVAQFHLIEKMELTNSQGQVVDKWEKLPTKFFIDTKKYAAGVYKLQVQTNLKTETVSVIIGE
jgi:hypothetical protein